MNKPSKKIIGFAIICGGIVLAILIVRLSEKGGIISSLFEKNGALADVSYTAGDSENTNPVSGIGDAPSDWQNSLSSGGSNAGTSTPQDAQSASSTKPLNASDVFSEDLFSKFMNYQSDGSIDDPTTQQNLADNLSQEAQTAFAYKQYDPSGLHIFNDSETNSVRFYATSFSTLQLNFLTNLSKLTGNIVTDDDLEKISKLYTDFANELYNLSVPAGVVRDHMTVVNNLSEVSAVYDDLAKYKSDPVTAIAGIQSYQKAEADQKNALTNIAVYLRSNDIIFINGEAGDFWNNF